MSNISEADQEDPRYIQFARWDKDNSGSVDAQELESILRAIYDSGLKEGKTIEDAEGDAKVIHTSLFAMLVSCLLQPCLSHKRSRLYTNFLSSSSV